MNMWEMISPQYRLTLLIVWHFRRSVKSAAAKFIMWWWRSWGWDWFWSFCTFGRPQVATEKSMNAANRNANAGTFGCTSEEEQFYLCRFMIGSVQFKPVNKVASTLPFPRAWVWHFLNVSFCCLKYEQIVTWLFCCWKFKLVLGFHYWQDMNILC